MKTAAGMAATSTPKAPTPTSLSFKPEEKVKFLLRFNIPDSIGLAYYLHMYVYIYTCLYFFIHLIPSLI